MYQNIYVLKKTTFVTNCFWLWLGKQKHQNVAFLSTATAIRQFMVNPPKKHKALLGWGIGNRYATVCANLKAVNSRKYKVAHPTSGSVRT